MSFACRPCDARLTRLSDCWCLSASCWPHETSHPASQTRDRTKTTQQRFNTKRQPMDQHHLPLAWNPPQGNPELQSVRSYLVPLQQISALAVLKYIFAKIMTKMKTLSCSLHCSVRIVSENSSLRRKSPVRNPFGLSFCTSAYRVRSTYFAPYSIRDKIVRDAGGSTSNIQSCFFVKYVFGVFPSLHGTAMNCFPVKLLRCASFTP